MKEKDIILHLSPTKKQIEDKIVKKLFDELIKEEIKEVKRMTEWRD